MAIAQLLYSESIANLESSFLLFILSCRPTGDVDNNINVPSEVLLAKDYFKHEDDDLKVGLFVCLLPKDGATLAKL